jgi:RHS repeat-associated protein
LVFSLHSSFTSQTYLSTSDHGLVIADGSDKWAIGWEDWTDFNYSDATVLVCYQGPSPGCPIDPQRVLGRGSFGNTASAQAYQSEPVNTATGNYVSEVTDAHLPGRGLAFDFVRTYNALSTETGVFGPGWTHSFTARIIPNADGSATFVSEDGAKTTYASDGGGGYARPPGAYGLLTPIGGGGYELLKREQIRYRFDAAGKLASVLDRNNNTIGLTYSSGRLTTITDTVGRQVTLSYNPDATLATLAFPPSRSVTYAYYPDGRLETATDPRGGTTTYAYDPAGRLQTITDQNGHDVVTNTYSPDGRVIEQVDARGFHTTFDWDPASQTSTMTDARGGQWIDDYDAGILMSRRDPLGNTTTYAFSADLGLSATVDPRGLKTETNVDGAGNLIYRRSAAPFGYIETWTYNGRHDPVTYVDRRGNPTSYTYDTAGNLKTVTGPPPVSPLTTYNYDPAGTGLLFSMVDPRGKSTSFGYDVQANRNRTTTPLGYVTTMTFDAGGRMQTLVEPRGNVAGGDPSQYTTNFTHDEADHVRTTTTPLGHVTRVDYDPAGNRTLVTDANNHTTGYEYDEANHLTAVIDADTRRTSYGYDQVGNLTGRTDANNHVATYAYDLAKRLTTETRPLGRVWAYQYDGDGNRTKVIDPIAAATPTTSDFQVTYAYDELNRVSTATFFGNGSATYGYDANDNRISLSDAAGASTYTYDTLDRLATYRRGTRGINYGYDAGSNVTTRTYTDGTLVTLAYNDDGRLASATSAGAVTTYGYDAAANLTTTTLPAANGYVESRTFDRSGRLTEAKNQRGATVLSRSTYTLDPVGNRLTMQTTTDNVSYTYDALDRLTQACYTPACAAPGDNFRRYTYDPVGNRLTEVRDTGTTTYTYDGLDQLNQTTGPGGTTTYTYDLDGRATASGNRTFTWTQPGRLASTRQGNTTTTYTYDGDGLRLQASTGNQASKKTQFDWDVNRPLPELVAERDGNAALLRRYVNGLNTISMTAGTSSYYFQYDGLGSIVNLTSATGATQWTYAYLPFGGVRTETKNDTQAPANVLRFTGEYLDPTALYHLRARQYDPGTGRFLSADPLRFRPGTSFVGEYVYANNRPTILVDPSGRDSVGLCINALAFLGIGGGAQICLVATGELEIGITATVEWGLGSPSLSAGFGPNRSDATSINDLGQHFNVKGASVGEVGGVSVEQFEGTGVCGQPVSGGGFSITGTSKGPPIEGHGGNSYTFIPLNLDFGGLFGDQDPACPGKTSK